jgi:hypothetical protein
MTISEWLVDAAASAVPYFGTLPLQNPSLDWAEQRSHGLVHVGMYLSALSMYHRVADSVADAIRESAQPVTELVFTGHSLGAAVAVLFAAFFSETDREWAAGANPRIVCHAHACPAVASADFPFASDTVALSYHRDPVPVLSVGHVIKTGKALADSVGSSPKPVAHNEKDSAPAFLPGLEEYYASLPEVTSIVLRPPLDLVFLHPLTLPQMEGRGMEADLEASVALRPDYEHLDIILRPATAVLDHHPKRYVKSLAAAVKQATADLL